MADARYLMLFGTLHGDNRLEVIPGYLSERRMPRLTSNTPPIDVQLLDDAGRVLVQDTLFTAPYCADGAESDDLLVRGAVPFREDARQIRFSYRGLELLTTEVSRDTPELHLTWRPCGTLRGRQTISWEASHPEGLELQYFLRYRTGDGGNWQRLTGRLTSTEHVLDFDQLAGGDRCQIAVVATDGVNTTTAESDAFVVARKPFQVFLLEPEDGEHFTAEQVIFLRGQAYSLEDQRGEIDSLRWTSDRDGDLGRGAPVELRGRLSPGPHEITLQSGDGEHAVRQSVTIYVEKAADAT